MSHDDLIEAAKAVRKNAHAPYSKFLVGAALETQTGARFVGCNVENASYGATICAERAAILAMVAAGERAPQRIAVYTESDEPAMPCGMCCQVLVEFNPKLELIVANRKGARSMRLDEVVPHPFILER